MTNDEITAQVAELARGLAPEFDGEVTSSTSLHEDLDLDSLTRIDLLSAVERTFGLEIPDSAIGRMQSVGDLTEFVAAKKG